jgi:hypothetical protein
MKSGALPYSSSDYAKAVGVFEFIQQGGYSQPAFKQAQEGVPKEKGLEGSPPTT